MLGRFGRDRWVREASAFVLGVGGTLLILSLASWRGRRDAGSAPSSAEVRALMQRMEQAADVLDPATIKLLLRESGTIAATIAAVDHALQAGVPPELSVDAGRNEIFVEITAERASETDNRLVVFELWLDEVRMGDAERFGDVEGFKVIAESVRIDAGETKALALSEHLLKPGPHILKWGVAGRHGDLSGTLRLCQRARGGMDVTVLAERGFSSDDPNYRSLTPIVFLVALGAGPGQGSP